MKNDQKSSNKPNTEFEKFPFAGADSMKNMVFSDFLNAIVGFMTFVCLVRQG